MYYVMRASAPSLHRESTDSLISSNNYNTARAYERDAPCMRIYITKGVQRYYTKIYYIIDFLVRHVRRTLFLCCFC